MDPTAATTSWLSPEGVTAIVSLLGMLATVVVALLERAGKHEAAARARTLRTRLDGAEGVIGAVVAGVHDVRRHGLAPAQAKQVADAIRARAEAMGVEQVLHEAVEQAKTREDPVAAARYALERIATGGGRAA